MIGERLQSAKSAKSAKSVDGIEGLRSAPLQVESRKSWTFEDCPSTWNNPTRNQWLGWRGQVLDGYGHGRHRQDSMTYSYYDVQLH
jgi:hypothetical protein